MLGDKGLMKELKVRLMERMENLPCCYLAMNRP